MIPVFCLLRVIIIVGWFGVTTAAADGWVDIPLHTLSLPIIPPYHTHSSHFIVYFFTVGRQARHRAQYSEWYPWIKAGLGRTGLDWNWVVFFVIALLVPLVYLDYHHSLSLVSLFKHTHPPPPSSTVLRENATAARIYEIPFGGEVAFDCKTVP
jgi:hypothetical protein